MGTQTNRLLKQRFCEVAQRFGIGEKREKLGISRGKKWMRKNSVVASMEGLECSKCAENIMQDLTFLYRSYTQLFSNPKKMIYKKMFFYFSKN